MLTSKEYQKQSVLTCVGTEQRKQRVTHELTITLTPKTWNPSDVQDHLKILLLPRFYTKVNGTSCAHHHLEHLTCSTLNTFQ
jgi:hypothetical protein